MYADGSQFFFRHIARRLHPDAGLPGNAVSGDAKVGRSADHRLFEGADIPVNVAADEVEIQDRVADNLAGAVVGDVATAIGFAKPDAFLAQHIFRGKEIFLAGVAAHGDDVWMLAEQENVVNCTGFACSDKALLQEVGVGPRNEAEVGGEKGVHGRHKFAVKSCQLKVNAQFIAS